MIFDYFSAELTGLFLQTSNLIITGNWMRTADNTDGLVIGYCAGTEQILLLPG